MREIEREKERGCSGRGERSWEGGREGREGRREYYVLTWQSICQLVFELVVVIIGICKLTNVDLKLFQQLK